MIAIKPRHLALTATLPTIFLIQATLSPQYDSPPCPSYDTRHVISSIDSPSLDDILIDVEDEIIEEGHAGVTIHNAFNPTRFRHEDARPPKASKFAWRWRYDLTYSATHHQQNTIDLSDGKLAAVSFHDDIATRGAERVPALERRDKTGKLLWSFVPRETARQADRVGVRVQNVMHRQGDIVYMVYFPIGLATGCEVYAVELETGLPLWRTVVEPFGNSGAYTNHARAELDDGVLDVHIFSDAKLSGARLDLRDGKIIEERDVTMMGHLMKYVPDATSLPPLRRVVVADGHYLHLERPHKAQPRGVQITHRDSSENSRWKLTMSGDVLHVFDDKNTPDILQVLTYDEKAGGALVTAVDMERGEIVWVNQLEGVNGSGGKLRQRHLVPFVGKYRGANGVLHEVLLVQGSEIREHGTEARHHAFIEAIDPETGEPQFNVQFLP